MMRPNAIDALMNLRIYTTLMTLVLVFPRELPAQADALKRELQRPVDARLELIESKGISGSGLFKGAIHRVQSVKEIQALSGRLAPGDQLVLAGSAWQDASFTFAGKGTMEAPILIRPEQPGSVVLSGASRVNFHGEHLIVTGLIFKDIVVESKGTVILGLGNGKEFPANHCIVNRVTIENCNSRDPADWPHHRMWYMSLRGQSNTVANSTFAQLRNFGQMLAAQELPIEGLLSLHILNNRFVERPKLDSQNGYEIIQIGWSGEKARSAGSLIQGNLFQNCDGENETITLKASDIFVRSNTFAGCLGVLCIREGDRVLVEGNTFDGKGRKGTGGVRLQGADHLIVHNIFRDIKGPPDYYCWPISMMAASSEKSGDDDGYARARNVLVMNNRFQNTEKRIAVGIYPRPEYPLLPRNIVISNNVFAGTSSTNACDFIAPDSTGEMAKNIYETNNRYLPIQ